MTDKICRVCDKVPASGFTISRQARYDWICRDCTYTQKKAREDRFKANIKPLNIDSPKTLVDKLYKPYKKGVSFICSITGLKSEK